MLREPETNKTILIPITINNSGTNPVPNASGFYEQNDVFGNNNEANVPADNEAKVYFTYGNSLNANGAKGVIAPTKAFKDAFHLNDIDGAKCAELLSKLVGGMSECFIVNMRFFCKNETGDEAEGKKGYIENFMSELAGTQKLNGWLFVFNKSFNSSWNDKAAGQGWVCELVFEIG